MQVHCHTTQALQGQTPAERIVDGHDMTEPKLQTLASNNPIATTAIFEQTVRHVRSILYGVDLDGKKNVPLDQRDRGIAGVPVVDSQVKENNKRGASHVHVPQFYGAASCPRCLHIWQATWCSRLRLWLRSTPSFEVSCRSRSMQS